MKTEARIEVMHNDLHHKIKLVGFSLLAISLSVALIVALEVQYRGIPLI